MLTKKTKLFAGMGALLFAGAANASLVGDTVGCNITGGGSFSCSAPTAIVGAGLEFTVGGGAFINVDIGASTIDLLFNSSGFLGGTIINLTDLDWSGVPNLITGATLLSSSGINGLAQSDLSTTSSSVSIDLIGTDFSQGATASISVQAVPEPTTLALMGLGLAGLGYRRKKIKVA